MANDRFRGAGPDSWERARGSAGKKGLYCPVTGLFAAPLRSSSRPGAPRWGRGACRNFSPRAGSTAPRPAGHPRRRRRGPRRDRPYPERVHSNDRGCCGTRPQSAFAGQRKCARRKMRPQRLIRAVEGLFNGWRRAIGGFCNSHDRFSRHPGPAKIRRGGPTGNFCA